MVRLCSSFAIVLIAAGAASADSTSVSGTAEPSSTPTEADGSTSQFAATTALPSMSTARTGHTATRLIDGRVLVAGGSPSFITAELYEAAQETFRPVADMTRGRRAHTATLLPSSGFVLIAGGVDQSGIDLSEAELFIPASAAFVPTHSMTTARSFHTATLLGNGQVLIAGGNSTGTTAELFNPTTRTFTRTGSMSRPRSGHVAVLLTNGRVLIIGGEATNTQPGTAELFDPNTGRFSPAGSMHASRTNFTATLISGGNVLITGGQWESYPLSSAEIWEASSGRFTTINAMNVARASHTATALPDGTVLIAGGTRQLAHQTCVPQTLLLVNRSVERFNPRTRQFALVTAADLGVPHAGHTATRLLTGDVLVTGGSTLVTELCGIVGSHRITKQVPTPTATATADLIRFTSDAAVTSQAVTSGSSATLSPASLTFSTQVIGTTSAADTVALKNTGTTSLTISSIAITGTDRADFAQTHTCGSSLAAGASCSISVTFRPRASGTRTAILSVTDNAAGSPQKVSLAGIGTAARLSRTSLNFGTVAIGKTSAAQTVTLTNVGTTTLTVSGIAITAKNAEDFWQTHNCTSSLAAGASCSISVKFRPTETGFRSAALTVSDNATGSPQTVSLGGAGAAGCIPQGSLCYGPGPNHCCPAPRGHHAFCSNPTGWGSCIEN